MKHTILRLSFGLGLILAPTFSTTAMGQLLSTREYFLRNKQTGKILDVRGGSTTPGTQIWQHTLNFTKAQRFRIILSSNYGTDAYHVQPQSSGLYLSLKHSLSNDVGSPPTTSVIGELPTTVTANDRLPQADPTGFIVVQDRRYEIRPLLDHSSPLAPRPRYQVWRFIPVPNERNTYTIQSTAFMEPMVLQPSGAASGSPLRISRSTGADMQKWIVLPTAPASPTELELSGFTWKATGFLFLNSKINGRLSWMENASNEDGFEAFVRRKEGNGFFSNYWSLGRMGRDRSEFNFADGSKHGEGREHCFVVRVFNRWGIASSNEACQVPSSGEAPPPPPPLGFATIAVYNCHSDGRSVRVWTYDLTANTGSWENRGIVSSQWSGSSCPAAASPLEIPLTADHSFSVIAIDCGDSPPNATNSSCHKVPATEPIPGKSGGRRLVLTVQ